jgi:hypothetical protein
MSANRAFVYVATGEAYGAEAMRSAESLRRWHAEARIVLVTDVPPGTSTPFDDVCVPSGPIEHTPIDKVLAYGVPAERIVFLDTDTFVLDDLSPIFDLLDRFDLAVLQDVNRGWNYQLPGVPLTFSEFNTGVIGFRKSPAMESFFHEWRAEYERLRKDPGFVSDQPSFRSVLYRSDLRVAPLPSEFHFLANYPNAALWNVRLIHGRGDYAQMAALANETLGLRAYVPELGVVTRFQGRKKLLGELCRFMRRAMRLMVSGSKHLQAGHPTGWHKGEPDQKGK